jgi:hypothetical protein
VQLLKINSLQYFLYGWITDMWGHVEPVPRVSDPIAEENTIEDLIAQLVTQLQRILLPINHLRATPPL